jgi:hypothetical protein
MLIAKRFGQVLALAAAAVVDRTTACLASLAADEAGAKVNCALSVVCGIGVESMGRARTDKTTTTHAQEGPLGLLLASLRQGCQRPGYKSQSVALANLILSRSGID